MSCIAFICTCFFSPPHDVSKDVDFERERYLTINPVENIFYIYFVYIGPTQRFLMFVSLMIILA